MKFLGLRAPHWLIIAFIAVWLFGSASGRAPAGASSAYYTGALVTAVVVSTVVVKVGAVVWGAGSR